MGPAANQHHGYDPLRKGADMRTFIQLIMIAAGSFLVVNSLFVSGRANFSLGIILPALVGFPLLLWGLFYRHLLLLSRQGFWHTAKIVMIVCYTLITVGTLIVAGLMIRQLNQKPADDLKAIIIPGAGLRGEKVSALLAARLNAAFSLWQQDPDVLLVVCGGQGPGELVPEADAMALYLTGRGVPEDMIIRESQSTNTRENLLLARVLLQQRLQLLPDEVGPVVCVVTSNYHVFRTVQQANHLGYQASGLGAPTLWYLLPGDFLRECLAIGRWFLLGY